MFGVGGDADLWDDFPLSSTDPKRRPALKGRITGEITEWKNRYGWIVPDAPINHPEARMKGGKIYLGQEDVAEVISGVGAHVSFYVYCDGAGLGALVCCPSDSPMASQPFKKRGLKVTPKPKMVPKATPVGRKRVSLEPITGIVKSWKGSFGFITPTEPVEHPLYTGSLFLSKGDVMTPEQMAIGSSVTFYLYADPQGLGAEEVTVVEGDASPSPASPTGQPAAIDLGFGSSTLLRARPKGAPGHPPASLDGSSAMTLGFARPTAKASAKGGSFAKPTAKAGPGMRPNDSELATKMAANPELAKRLSAWMFDSGG